MHSLRERIIDIRLEFSITHKNNFMVHGINGECLTTGLDLEKSLKES